MLFHEKSLELNITHELLNLADSWSWFLTDIPLWRYWRPRHRLPFFKFPKSTSAGFNPNVEGRTDPTGEKGGGYDVRIKSGIGGYLLFIQYKRGDLITNSPDPRSVFDIAPHDHFVFEFNSTKTNQHFVLKELVNGVGSEDGNAVVYAFPLIADMDDLEKNAGRLIRKTKFISVTDIEAQATQNNVTIARNQHHNFRVGKFDMNKCEVNYYYYAYFGVDRTSEIVTDIICLKFEQTLRHFLKEIYDKYRDYYLFEGYIPEGLQQAFIQYVRYLLHYFEASPSKISVGYASGYSNYFLQNEFDGYESTAKDLSILNSVFTALEVFEIFIRELDLNKINPEQIPRFKPSLLIPISVDGLAISFQEEHSKEVIEGINYLII